jgi:hypothetical protein
LVLFQQSSATPHVAPADEKPGTLYWAQSLRPYVRLAAHVSNGFKSRRRSVSDRTYVDNGSRYRERSGEGSESNSSPERKQTP